MEFVQGRIEHQHHRSRDANHPIALARIIKNGQEKKWMPYNVLWSCRSVGTWR